MLISFFQEGWYQLKAKHELNFLTPSPWKTNEHFCLIYLFKEIGEKIDNCQSFGRFSKFSQSVYFCFYHQSSKHPKNQLNISTHTLKNT